MHWHPSLTWFSSSQSMFAFVVESISSGCIILNNSLPVCVYWRMKYSSEHRPTWRKNVLRPGIFIQWASFSPCMFWLDEQCTIDQTAVKLGLCVFVNQLSRSSNIYCYLSVNMNETLPVNPSAPQMNTGLNPDELHLLLTSYCSWFSSSMSSFVLN